MGEFVMPEVIKIAYTQQISRALAAEYGLFGPRTEPTPQMKAWYRHGSDNVRRVKIDYPYTVEDSIAALRDAAQGLQYATVEWGGEMDGPSVEGYVAGILCLHPDKDCQLLLGHGGEHEGQRISHFPRAIQ